MPYTMHEIQLNQAHSHHCAIRKFTQGLPSLRQNFEGIISERIRHHIDQSPDNSGGHSLAYKEMTATFADTGV